RRLRGSPRGLGMAHEAQSGIHGRRARQRLAVSRRGIRRNDGLARARVDRAARRRLVQLGETAHRVSRGRVGDYPLELCKWEGYDAAPCQRPENGKTLRGLPGVTTGFRRRRATLYCSLLARWL